MKKKTRRNKRERRNKRRKWKVGRKDREKGRISREIGITF